jgi:hypothetical protein
MDVCGAHALHTSIFWGPLPRLKVEDPAQRGLGQKRDAKNKRSKSCGREAVSLSRAAVSLSVSLSVVTFYYLLIRMSMVMRKITAMQQIVIT